MKALLPLLVFGLMVGGCGNNMSDDGLSKDQQQASSRIDKIAKESGGDWSKVSQADRDYLVNEVSMGSEETAKRMIQGHNGQALSPGGPSSK